MAGLDETMLPLLAQLSERLPARELAVIVERLTTRYRDGAEPSTRARKLSFEEVIAYGIYRMPATFAATRSALFEVAAVLPTYRPRSLVDVGGGLGAGAYAGVVTWDSLDAITVLDSNDEMLRLGRELGASGRLAASATWERLLLGADPTLPGSDLVVCSYLLAELSPEVATAAVRAACRAAAVVLVVEPGTPAGFRRVLAARRVMLEEKHAIAAPCPHDLDCPIAAGDDWCHFAARLNRTSVHRLAKGASLGHEDEKFSYVCSTSLALRRPQSRVVRHPMKRKSIVTLTLCSEPPAILRRQVPKSENALYRAARGAGWGDVWPPPATRGSADPGGGRGR